MLVIRALDCYYYQAILAPAPSKGVEAVVGTSHQCACCNVAIVELNSLPILPIAPFDIEGEYVKLEL